MMGVKAIGVRRLRVGTSEMRDRRREETRSSLGGDWVYIGF